MTDFLREIFKSDAGFFGFVFAVPIVICYAIHYITKFATKISAELDLFSKRINKMEANTDRIKEDIVVIKETVVAILIRDKYFSENNIDIDEVDKNDSQKDV